MQARGRGTKRGVASRRAVVLDNNPLFEFTRAVESLVRQDPGNRGLARWAIENQLWPAASSVASGNHCLILTGFFIPASRAIETDGPLGCIVLAHSLLSLGRRVTVLSDKHAQTIMRAGLDAVGCSADLFTFSKDDPIRYADIVTADTTHCIALERPGLAVDGYYHNTAGEIISEYVAPFDRMFLDCHKAGVVTIGIGDGGNELGMGNVAQAVGSFLSPDRPYACVIPSDFCICAGVSNWGGYALATLLSIVEGTNLLLPPGDFPVILDEIVRAGAVDGVTGKRTSTVDNLPRRWEDEIYRALYRIAETQSHKH